MHILHILQSYRPAQGGAEIHMAELSERLAAAGHQVTVVTTNAHHFEYFWNPQALHFSPGEITINGVRVLRFAVHHLPFLPRSYQAWRRLLWGQSRLKVVPTAVLRWWASFTPYVPTLRHWLQTTAERFDLVAGMNIGYETLLTAGQQFAHGRDIPFALYPLTHLGAGSQPGADRLGQFYTMRHQIALVCQSDLLLAQTETEKRFYMQQGLPPARAVIAGVGVNPAEIVGGDGPRWRAAQRVTGTIVTALGTMSYDKGTVTLLQAAGRLWDAGLDFTLVLAGRVTAEIQPWLARHRQRPQLCVRAAISDEEKRDLLAATDIFALPSRTDSFGIVFLEAWLYAVPVIGAAVWGVGDVIAGGEDGFLVPFGDAAALADKLAWLIDHPAERQRMGANGRRKVYAQYTWSHVYEVVEQAYTQLVERP